MSSREGLDVNPFTGIYSASRHATKAMALPEFNIEVATMNPGPFLTGFNDRGFDTWKSWLDEPFDRLSDYAKLTFLCAHLNLEPASATLTGIAAGEVDPLRISSRSRCSTRSGRPLIHR